MILPKVRDPRFVTIRIEEADEHPAAAKSRTFRR
jgi:hypothetical protein